MAEQMVRKGCNRSHWSGLTRGNLQAAREASGDAYYFEITNQDGRKVDLPAATRKGLTLGLSLHDRGKKEVDTGNVASGLEYLLAADKAFSGCETEYLKLVDNYGFLCLGTLRRPLGRGPDFSL